MGGGVFIFQSFDLFISFFFGGAAEKIPFNDNIYTDIHTYIYIYIYLYLESDRDRQRFDFKWLAVGVILATP